MYHFLRDRLGERAAAWGAALWYTLLMIIVALSFAAPAGEFRYGSM